MPYRQVAPLARYPVHSSTSYRAAVMLGIVLTLGGPLLLALLVPARRIEHQPFVLLLTASPGVLVLLAYLSGAGAHSVAGGRGAIVLYPSHIVLPPPRGTREIVFPLDAVHVRRTTIRGRISFLRVSEVHVMELSAGGQARTLGSRMFDDPATLHRIASDIERARGGLDLEHSVGPEARDRYDDVLDEELSKL